MRRLVFAAALLLVLAPALHADDTSLTRDEVTVVKRKLQAIEGGLGTAPQGYERASENFNLPTEYSVADAGTKMYYPVNGTVNLKYDGGTQRIGQQAGANMQDLQKKMSDAMAAGNYDEVGKIQQQMSQQINATQSAAMTAGSKGTIDVGVTLNEGGGNPIDPDNVLFERPGVLALKSADANNPGQSRVTVFVDPVALKNTRSLSTVKLRHDPTPKKTAALNAAIDISGPTAPVEAWAKQINVEAVLAQLDR